jgi:SAM-dependent methyltransferase
MNALLLAKRWLYSVDTRFWLKNLIYRLNFEGYGYYRHLKTYNDPTYVHERDKHPVRFKHYGSEGWSTETQGAIRYRQYDNYEEYITHQQQKFDEMLKLSGGFNLHKIVGFRKRFYSRFKHLKPLLPPSATIICAGARQGTEVEVLWDLGFKNAYGIDLNPGPNNPYVRKGDFMHMDAPTSSVDLLYTNCVDHAFNLEDFFAEHARVIKPDGYVLYDISLQAESGAGPFEAVAWETDEDLFLLMLKYFQTVIKVESEQPAWKWVLLRGKREVVP